ncbi:MAG: BLUF domain-containing protein [Oxalobacteraceae bacterium]|nr:MAG: BLUF domain-containing protein [Oxalobacteraceae bacterium]
MEMATTIRTAMWSSLETYTPCRRSPAGISTCLMHADPLRQILYHSWAVGRPDLDSILAVSKRNNGIDGITGILLCDGRSYLQVLEGPQDSVTTTYERICADPRHSDITIISDQLIEQRDFAYWSMEVREPGQPSDDATFRLRRRLEQFSPDLRRHFFD